MSTKDNSLYEKLRALWALREEVLAQDESAKALRSFIDACWAMTTPESTVRGLDWVAEAYMRIHAQKNSTEVKARLRITSAMLADSE